MTFGFYRPEKEAYAYLESFTLTSSEPEISGLRRKESCTTQGDKVLRLVL